MQSCTTYRRIDGVIGVGFVIDFAGKAQHSIAWPDRPAERMMSDELETWGIKTGQVGLTQDGCPEPCCEPEQERPAVNDSVEDVSQEEPAVAEASADAIADSESEQEQEQPAFVFDADGTEAGNIRSYLTAFPEATNQEVIRELNSHGMEVSSSQVSYQRNRLAELAKKHAPESAADAKE